jgi:hypothetical protein
MDFISKRRERLDASGKRIVCFRACRFGAAAKPP